MRFFKTILACACLVALTQTLWAQHPGRTSHQPPLSYIDPATGEFKQVIPQADGNILATVAPAFGTIVFKITINLKSTIPATDLLVCTGSTTVIDAGTQALHEENASVAATRTSTGGSCTVSLPYSWALSTATQDRVSLEYGVTTAPASPSGNPLPSRQSIHGLGSIPVPPNSTIPTTETVTVTM